MTYTCTRVFGLQRSGNHAIINWLLGLQCENTLFFNNRKVGDSLLESPSGVSVPAGVHAHATREDGKVCIHNHLIDRFRREGTRLIVSYENFDINQYDEDIVDRPIADLFGSSKSSLNVIILRNPFNTISSLARMYPIQRHAPSVNGEKYLQAFRKNVRRIRRVFADPQLVRRKLQSLKMRETTQGSTQDPVLKIMQRWPAYARCTRRVAPIGLVPTVPVIYDFWLQDKKYRDEVAKQISMINKDKFLDFVSDAGGGSSFSATKISGVGLLHTGVLERWQATEDRDRLVAICNDVPDIVTEAISVFGLRCVPEELKGLIR